VPAQLLLDFLAMSHSAKFAHNDIVKIISSGDTGTATTSRENESGYVYTVQLTHDPAMKIDALEDGIELVKRANEDETGLAIRYIS
jgi:hypothetical protein